MIEAFPSDSAVVAGLDAKVAVVTGGASGIGQACAAVLRASGAAAVVADVRGDPPVDGTDRASLETLRDRVEAEHGRLDVLLNCAGTVGVNGRRPRSPRSSSTRSSRPTTAGRDPELPR